MGPKSGGGVWGPSRLTRIRGSVGFLAKKHLKGVRGLRSLIPLPEHPKSGLDPKTPTDPRIRSRPQTRKDFWPLFGAKRSLTPEHPANSGRRRRRGPKAQKRPLHPLFSDHFCAKRKNPGPKGPRPEWSRLFARRAKRTEGPFQKRGRRRLVGPKAPKPGVFGQKRGQKRPQKKGRRSLVPKIRGFGLKFRPKNPKFSTALTSTILGRRSKNRAEGAKRAFTSDVFWPEGPKDAEFAPKVRRSTKSACRSQVPKAPGPASRSDAVRAKRAKSAQKSAK